MGVSVNDIFLLTIDGRLNLQRVITTLTYRVSAWTGTSTDYELALAMAQAFASAGLFDLEDVYAGAQANNWICHEIRAQKIKPTRYRYARVAGSASGAFADNALSSNVCADITLWAALAGRKYVSTKHCGFIPSAAGSYDSGLITNGYKTPLLALRDKLLASWTSAGLGVTMVPCILHRSGPIVSSDIVDGTVQDTVRVMRRRTVGLGE